MTDTTITITDDQARLIGFEAGREFAKMFWDNVNAANPYRMSEMPASFLIRCLGDATGSALNKAMARGVAAARRERAEE